VSIEDESSSSAIAQAQKAAWDASHGWSEPDDAMGAAPQDGYGYADDDDEEEYAGQEEDGDDDDDDDDDEYGEDGSALGTEQDDSGIYEEEMVASRAQEAMYSHAFHHLQAVQHLRHQREQMRTQTAIGQQEPESPPDERGAMQIGDLRGRVSVGPGGVTLDLSRFEITH